MSRELPISVLAFCAIVASIFFYGHSHNGTIYRNIALCIIASTVCVLLFFSSSEFIGERTGNFDGIVHINMTHINENELYERL